MAELGGIGHVDLGTDPTAVSPHVGEVTEQPTADEARSTGQVGAHGLRLSADQLGRRQIKAEVFARQLSDAAVGREWPSAQASQLWRPAIASPSLRRPCSPRSEGSAVIAASIASASATGWPGGDERGAVAGDLGHGRARRW